MYTFSARLLQATRSWQALRGTQQYILGGVVILRYHVDFRLHLEIKENIHVPSVPLLFPKHLSSLWILYALHIMRVENRREI
jgi:hypothetical protein